MSSRNAIVLLLIGYTFALTSCDGLFAPEVINEITEHGDGGPIQALDAYIQFEGLKGEATTEGYEGWSRVYSLKDGVTNVPALFGGDGPGNPDFEPIRIVMEQDAASPGLFQHLVESRHIPKASIAVLRNAGSHPYEYYRYDLDGVFVTKYQFADFNYHDGAPTVAIELAFQAITITYTPLEVDGSPGVPVTASWNLLEQKK